MSKFKIVHKNAKGRDVSDYDIAGSKFDDPLETNNMVIKYLHIAEFEIGDTITAVLDLR